MEKLYYLFRMNLGFLLILSLIPIGIFLGGRTAFEAALIYIIIFGIVEVLLKKMKWWTQDYDEDEIGSFTHLWRGAEEEEVKPQMRIIKVSSKDGREFNLNIGFRFAGYCWYFGRLRSKNGEVIFRTWVAYKVTEFLLRVNINKKHITTSHGAEVQDLTAHASFYPHWYQRVWPLYYFV